ncbi:hypothetical protein AVEN_202308-1 [Araneus ventricosus]|uniref:Uncharacterized protein n=1 Tax=Araneus ventricosus TaxID=182803 RepID=A0A4Y2JT27_ARAVE|nr:hypothetical protein AVEN_202308-1 [Araneus ventricosus]
MEQHIAELLKQNQELILALQRTHGSSQKVTVQFEKFDEENENFDSFFERFQTYLDVQNIPADSRAKRYVRRTETNQRNGLNSAPSSLLEPLSYAKLGEADLCDKNGLPFFTESSNLMVFGTS